MFGELKPWQMAAMLLLFPPVGAFCICTSGLAARWHKIAALVYCALVFLILLSLRRPVGEVIIDAVPIS